MPKLVSGQVLDRLAGRPIREAKKHPGTGEYENLYRLQYKDGATFVPVCEKCGRFVTADVFVLVNEATGLKDEPNATCSKCGRTKMLFEGFI